MTLASRDIHDMFFSSKWGRERLASPDHCVGEVYSVGATRVTRVRFSFFDKLLGLLVGEFLL